MKYYKIINGELVIRDNKNIIVHKNNKQIINPSDELITNDGWLPYSNDITYTDDISKLNDAINDLIDKIVQYDKSNNVEEFYINDIPLWLDRDERAILQRRFEIELKNNINTSTLWKNGIKFNINVSDGMRILDNLELYAIKCFDVTNMHIDVAKQLKSIEDVESYDYKLGYPEKIKIQL